MIVEKVYDFTNENLVDLSQIYHFTDANILTVLGSGDQYFSALLAGAKNVEVFDINHLTLYHFILKFTAIKVLSYEEFIQMFVVDNLDNLRIYAKLRDFLPSKVSDFFDTLKNGFDFFNTANVARASCLIRSYASRPKIIRRGGFCCCATLIR